MREILFKGFRTDGGGWIEGDLLKGFAGDADSYTIRSHDLYREVYENSLGQYTGEIDSKGNKIFENDILINSKGNSFVVEFKYHGFYLVSMGDIKTYNKFDGILFDENSNMEVVSNLWIKRQIPDKFREDRGVVLLNAVRELLEIQEKSGVVVDILSQSVYYDDTMCDGYCVLDDIRAYLEELGVGGS